MMPKHKIQTSYLSLFLVFLFAGMSMISLSSCDDVPFDDHLTAHEKADVYLDEGHLNAYTLDSLYNGFGAVLDSVGFSTSAWTGEFLPSTLDTIDFLVLADAGIPDIAPRGAQAYTAAEVQAINDWVLDGGSLMLIADAYYSQYIVDLAASFGLTFYHGFVTDANGGLTGKHYFSDGTLPASPVQVGRQDHERIDSVKTYWGTAFDAPFVATPVLEFPQGAKIIFEEDTILAAGKHRGAIMPHGSGRLAVFAEGTMFSSSLYQGTNSLQGLVDPDAAQNQQFLLNIARWLDDGLCGE